MNNEDDDLTRDYRRASAARAGEPGESTRRAILEGARDAARLRRPAANDARYAWGAVAGVAVLGIALLLWRQSATHFPATASLPPAGTSTSRPAAPAPAPPQVAEARHAMDARKAEAEVDAATDSATATAALDPVAEKLRSRFPDAWASASPPAMVWIIEDAQGQPLRQGTLSPGESLPALLPEAASAPASAQARQRADRAEGALSATGSAEAVQPGEAGWTMQTVLNSAGIPVRIATAKESR
jgi:hypothetical protein